MQDFDPYFVACQKRMFFERDVPFAFNSDDRTELPDGGWDEVIRWGHDDAMTGPNALSALEINLLPEARGRGNSVALLSAMKACAKINGLGALFAPVRPNQKHLQPRTSMRDYVDTVRADGFPVDAWLRTHLRIGGKFEKIAPCSMTIVGSLADWSLWTGMPFRQSGELLVEGALSPVLVSLEQDCAVYVEPNVWVQHLV